MGDERKQLKMNARKSATGRQPEPVVALHFTRARSERILALEAIQMVVSGGKPWPTFETLISGSPAAEGGCAIAPMKTCASITGAKPKANLSGDNAKHRHIIQGSKCMPGDAWPPRASKLLDDAWFEGGTGELRGHYLRRPGGVKAERKKCLPKGAGAELSGVRAATGGSTRQQDTVGRLQEA